MRMNTIATTAATQPRIAKAGNSQNEVMLGASGRMKAGKLP